jgi:NAD(P)-dependent dehydrogenase (short-subunit alcohol dehydrogenase family)
MPLRPLLSTANMVFGGGVVFLFTSVLTWHFSRQVGRSHLTPHNMALTARSVVVTGAGRGLGLEYVRQLVKLQSPPEVLIATSRDPSSSSELKAVAKENPSVKIVKLDVEDDESIQSAFKEVKALVGDRGLNLLINNAAIYDQTDDGSLSQQTRARLQKHFDANVSGPLMVTQAFLPLLQRAASLSNDAPISFSKAGVVMMTSYMGSQQITLHDGAGTSLHYKTSKSALNMAAIVLARDLKDRGIVVTALHPGWVKTDMGGPEAMFTPKESISGCLKVIGGAGEDLSGKLVTFEGKELPY